MANGDVMAQNFLRFPTISFPSLLSDIQDLLPTSNLLNGLSVSEDDKNVYVEAAVPGIDPKNVEVLFEKGLLTIRGEKEEEEKTKKYLHKATSTFLYRVAPEDIDTKVQPQASYKNGMMKITFAKAMEAKPVKIEVKAE